VFDIEDAGGVRENHWLDGEYMGSETFLVCPNCGGDFEDAADCCECGETFTENEIYDGWCEKCLRETINYDTFFEYCEENKDHHYLDTFVMCYLLNCDEVPKYPSFDFHELMISVYKNQVRSIKEAKARGSKYVSDILDTCVQFIMDDNGSIGRENYADWLNKKEANNGKK
jgi:hypothetical protein